MQEPPDVSFGPFRLDVVNERVWKGKRKIILRPKTFAVLRHLITHAGRLVRKEEIINAIWSEATVSDGVLIVCIGELRDALGDRGKTPRFIETVSRRGYRFIAPVAALTPSILERETRSVGLAPVPPPDSQAPSLKPQAPTLVGREAELMHLSRVLERMLHADRQFIVVTGEPGIGKTTLVDMFRHRFLSSEKFWIGQGQCVEPHGAGEAYMPVLDAIARLCRASNGAQVIATLRRYAPSWLMQMPWLTIPSEGGSQEQGVPVGSQERRLREIAEALEVLTHEKPLVLILEDLQWCDYSTVDLLAFLARRQEPARLLLLGTGRLSEAATSRHPLSEIINELRLHRHCEELQLPQLTEAATCDYIVARFPCREEHLPTLNALAHVIYQRTEGNPLFFVNLVEDLMVQGVLYEQEAFWQFRGKLDAIELSVPESIRQMIHTRVARLTIEEQRLLETASVAGIEFSATSVAAGLESAVIQAEERCEELAHRGQFLRSAGVSEWPDGTVSMHYTFIHSLYQQVLYQRVIGMRRVQLHRRIGEREEIGYGPYAHARAAQLAQHFSLGRDFHRAVVYLQQAAKNAVQHCAFHEAMGHFSAGLALLNNWPDTPERVQQELQLYITLLGPLMALKGEASLELEQVFRQIWQLLRNVGESTPPFWLLLGRWLILWVRGEVQAAFDLSDQILMMAQQREDPVLLMWAHHTVGVTALYRGEFESARVHLEQALRVYASQQHHHHMVDPRIVALGYLAIALWTLGYPDQARKRSEKSLAIALEVAHPYRRAEALAIAAGLSLSLRDQTMLATVVEELEPLAHDQEFIQFMAVSRFLKGTLQLSQGHCEKSIRLIEQGIAAYHATEAEFGIPGFTVVLANLGVNPRDIGAGDERLGDVENTMLRRGECMSLAELYRVRGELLLNKECRMLNDERRTKREAHDSSSIHPEEAEACFLKALELARRQQAKIIELRVAMSLGRLWLQQGKKKEARHMLEEIYNWFIEGFDTTDLREAQALLQQLKEDIQ